MYQKVRDGGHMAELATLERILKERDRIDLYIKLLESGDEKDRELVLAMLRQESKSLNEAIENK